jgi:hypothetical protein
MSSCSSVDATTSKNCGCAGAHPYRFRLVITAKPAFEDEDDDEYEDDCITDK